MSVLDGLVDQKTNSVMSVFFSSPDKFFHINKVSQESGVSLASTFRIMNALVDLDIIEFQTISKFKIYRLKKNKKTKELGKII